ncbi:uncharacterized protein BCR38DRAFT_414915 [Pseudomassariella vexata]|uniref:Uncharacterized protein n=1 Tax=Pseudomassariella vexata TaxID=1141098 RepID=A0A1Y2D9W5_9PEZI|nr:uncharacterized protein BCR38DRAFT_414915 [Pseudomassariella vexata]ORY55465.1 hypothetical protein BCR38DRAFT_414915 [Pseudomassariella vexata]
MRWRRPSREHSHKPGRTANAASQVDRARPLANSRYQVTSSVKLLKPLSNSPASSMAQYNRAPGQPESCCAGNSKASSLAHGEEDTQVRRKPASDLRKNRRRREEQDRESRGTREKEIGEQWSDSKIFSRRPELPPRSPTTLSRKALAQSGTKQA